MWRRLSGPRKTHKHRGIFSGNGVRRFTGGCRPQDHLPRLICDGFGPVFRRSGIRGKFSYVSFLYVPLCRLSFCRLKPPCTVRALMQKPPRLGEGSLVFCGFSRLLVVFLGLPASFPTLRALFQGLCFCGGVSVDRSLPVTQSDSSVVRSRVNYWKLDIVGRAELECRSFGAGLAFDAVELGRFQGARLVDDRYSTRFGINSTQICFTAVRFDTISTLL